MKRVKHFVSGVRRYLSKPDGMGWFVVLIFVIFAGLRLVPFIVNVAEWGDSYYILINAESLRSFHYDDKRHPLYAMLIALGGSFLEPVFWAKSISLLSSCGTYVMINLTLKRLTQSDAVRLLSLLFWAINPISSYWSSRVVTDPTFAFLVSLTFVSLYVFQRKKSLWSGVATGLAIWTRPEGVLLLVPVAVYFAAQRKWREIGVALGIASVILAPFVVYQWSLYGNPFHSSYFSDPGGMTLSLRAELGVGLYALFALGSPISALWMVRGVSKRYSEGLLLPLIVYTGLQLALFFIWGPVERLLIPIMPLLALFAAEGVFMFHSKLILILVVSLLVGVYTIGVGLLHLPLLTGFGSPLAFLLVVLFTGIWLVSLLLRTSERVTRFSAVALVVCSCVSLSLIGIWSSRYNYATTFWAVQELTPLEGTVAHDDPTGIAAWYLRGRELQLQMTESMNASEQMEWLNLHDVRYVLTTSEDAADTASGRMPSITAVHSQDFRDQFKLVRRFELEYEPPLRRVLVSMGLLNPLVQWAEIYCVSTE